MIIIKINDLPICENLQCNNPIFFEYKNTTLKANLCLQCRKQLETFNNRNRMDKQTIQATLK